MDEPAEDAEADTDASDVGDYEHYCVAVAFEFVHGLLGLVSDKVTTAFPFCDLLRQIFFRALHPKRYKFLNFAIIRTVRV